MGEGLYQLAHPLVQQVGVVILVVFLTIVGVVLLTGASLATALRATGSGLSTPPGCFARSGRPQPTPARSRAQKTEPSPILFILPSPTPRS